MALAKHVDPDAIVNQLRTSDEHSQRHHLHIKNSNATLTPYSSRYNAQDEISKFKIPQKGAPVSTLKPSYRVEILKQS